MVSLVVIIAAIFLLPLLPCKVETPKGTLIKSSNRVFYNFLESVKKEFETSQDWKAMQKAEGEEYEGVGFAELNQFLNDIIYRSFAVFTAVKSGH